MFKCIFAICSILLITSCSPSTPEEERENTRNTVESNMKYYMQYVIDPRTGICFVRNYIDGYYIYSPVTCTDSVMKNIINKQE